jgi:hypothetical protein
MVDQVHVMAALGHECKCRFALRPPVAPDKRVREMPVPDRLRVLQVHYVPDASAEVRKQSSGLKLAQQILSLHFFREQNVLDREIYGR